MLFLQKFEFCHYILWLLSLLCLELQRIADTEAQAVGEDVSLPKKTNIYALRQVIHPRSVFLLKKVHYLQNDLRLVTTQAFLSCWLCFDAQKLQQLEKRKKKLSVFEELRNEGVDFMHSLFRFAVNVASRSLLVG